jgi:protein SDA1
LTPADWAKIAELRTKAAEEEYKSFGTTTSKRKLEMLKKKKKDVGDGEADNWIVEGDIEGWKKKEKMSREERMESIMKGREGREKFGSRKVSCSHCSSI